MQTRYWTTFSERFTIENLYAVRISPFYSLDPLFVDSKFSFTFKSYRMASLVKGKYRRFRRTTSLFRGY